MVRRVLLPLLDLINHANDDAANAVVGREGGFFVARTIKDIEAGEEVRRAGRGGLRSGVRTSKRGRGLESAVMGLPMCTRRSFVSLLLTLHVRTYLTFLRILPYNLRSNYTLPQVRFSYSNGNARNDHALQHYGFLNRDQAADPLLCCVDEPGGDLWNCPEPGAGLLERAEQLNEQGG